MDLRVASGGGVVRHFDAPYLELLRLLQEAADVEHSLMVQYLYAAFSIRPQYPQLAGTAVGAKGEPTTLLGVAVQEMNHLHAVNRLLVDLGAAPNLTRQDLPYEPEIYPFALSLEPLTRLSAARYAYVEAPSDVFTEGSDPDFTAELAQTLDPGPRPNHLGVLYGAIEAELARLSTSDLSEQKNVEWALRLGDIRTSGEQEHFNFFRQVFMGSHAAFEGTKDPWSLSRLNGRYPSLPLPSNPTAYKGHANQIEQPVARDLAWLGNLHYWIVLILLDLHYRTGDAQDLVLAKRHMRGPLHRLGFELARNWGEGMPFDILNLGYAPGKDAAGTEGVLYRLVAEAERKANAIKGSLPAGFERGIYRDTLQRADRSRRPV